VLGSAAAVAFVPSTDLDRSQRFFTEVLDLAVEQLTPYACVLRAGSTMLRVTRVDGLTPQPFTVFGWAVDDLRSVATGLTARGVTFLRYDGMNQDEAGVWTTPGGDLIAWFRDPDGNILSLTEFAAG
jgi:catechol 2,3-dioxygenase-like lactoylglutathione lyase family enzyme